MKKTMTKIRYKQLLSCYFCIRIRRKYDSSQKNSKEIQLMLHQFSNQGIVRFGAHFYPLSDFYLHG